MCSVIALVSLGFGFWKIENSTVAVAVLQGTCNDAVPAVPCKTVLPQRSSLPGQLLTTTREHAHMHTGQ